MALDFAARIHALSNFNADGTDDTNTDDDFDESAAQWLTDGAREIINIFPGFLKEKCMTETTLTSSSQTMDMDGVGEILFVTRMSANSGGFRVPCRKIPSIYGGLTESSSGDMMYEASATDPVYWIWSSNDASILNVRPSPTNDQTAIVYHVGYPTFTAGGGGALDVETGTSIANFPDEAENLVVLYAAIKATEYMMLAEEDMEVYAPQLQTLKQDYKQGIEMLLGKQASGGGQ